MKAIIVWCVVRLDNTLWAMLTMSPIFLLRRSFSRFPINRFVKVNDEIRAAVNDEMDVIIYI